MATLDHTRDVLHHQHEVQRTWHAIGDADAMSLPEAWSCAIAIPATATRGRGAVATPPGRALFKRVPEDVCQRRAWNWKPWTFAVTSRMTWMAVAGCRRIKQASRFQKPGQTGLAKGMAPANSHKKDLRETNVSESAVGSGHRR